jgi:Ras family protein T1
MFIQKGRLETTWQILRSFGYGDDLALSSSFLDPPSSLSKGGTVELSRDGYSFFTELFQSFDADKDGALNITELDLLFSTSPGNPWNESKFPHSTITNASDAVTLQGFLAQWSMTTLIDYKITLAYLAYLGFPGDQTSALKCVTSEEKSVFRCLVFGGTGSGKTCLLRALVDKSFDEIYSPTVGKSVVVNSVEIHGGERYLVMQEYGPLVDGEVLDAKGGLEGADLVCLVYDCGDVNSFSYVAELWVCLHLTNQKKYEFESRGIPAVFCATKSDLDVEQQRYLVQPDAFCRQLGVPVPVSVSIKERGYGDIFQTLVGVALEPGLALPGREKKRRGALIASQRRNMFGLGAVGVVLIALVVYRFRSA